jgi:hypothetical protein
MPTIFELKEAMASTSAAGLGSKRKRVVLSLESKLAILDRLKFGATQVKLAEEYGVGKSTIASIKKNEEKLCSFVLMMDGLAVDKKKCKVI